MAARNESLRLMARKIIEIQRQAPGAKKRRKKTNANGRRRLTVRAIENSFDFELHGQNSV